MQKIVMGKDKKTGQDKLQIFQPLDARKLEEERILKKYPKIFRQKDLPINQTAMCWGLDCGIGWYKIIDELCEKIQEYCDKKGFQVEAEQVKEKFGGLRFYCNGDDYVFNLTQEAEQKSYKTCESCGSTDNVRQTKGWIVSLCPKCMNIYKKERGCL